MKKIACFIGCFISCIACFANIRLPSIINSNMVLQQQSAVKLWGWAAPAEKIFITTSWNNKTDSVVTTGDANWQATVQTPAAGGPYTITLKGNNEVVLDNVLIGEVWVCSGQSNMQMSQEWGLPDVKAELPNSYNKNIRFFQIPQTTSLYPQDDCVGQWKVCDSNTLKSFSAVGYFFGRKLNTELNVPIGLINSSWGGTPAETWTPEKIVNADTTLVNAAAKIKPAAWWPHAPGLTYNAMIFPLTNYTIAGTIWYQGESNTNTAATYTQLLTAMIDSWRRQWNKDFPFYFVQIAPFKYGNYNIGPLLQEAQTAAMKHSNVGMAVITDLVDDTNDIHPKNKHDVGLRLANWALAKTYHKPIAVYKSLFYSNLDVQKGKAVITFDETDAGLHLKDKKIKELYVAGEDKIFYPAEAKIQGDKLIVWSKNVTQPAAVRYAFGNTAIGNLFGKGELPVAPFRTDQWDVDTSEIK